MRNDPKNLVKNETKHARPATGTERISAVEVLLPGNVDVSALNWLHPHLASHETTGLIKFINTVTGCQD